MTRLNKALQSPESASTGPQFGDKVNESTHKGRMEKEIQKLRQKIEAAKAGKGEFANNDKKIKEWETFLFQKQKEFNTADVADTQPVGEKPVEPVEVEPAQASKASLEKRPKKKGDEIVSQIPTEDTILSLEGNPAKTDDLPILENNLIRLKELQTELRKLFIQARGVGNTIALDLIKQRQNLAARAVQNIEIAITVKRRAYFDATADTEIIDMIPAEETIEEKGRRRSLVENKLADIQLKLTEAKKGDNLERYTDLVLQRRKLQQELDTLDEELKRSTSARQPTTPPTPEANTPTLEEVEKIASYHILENLKGLAQDTRRELARKKQSLEAIHGQLEKWSEDENSATSMKRTIALKLKTVKGILEDINARDTFQNKTKKPNKPRDPKEIKTEKQRDFLEQIRDGHAIYARAIEDLSMNIRANKQDIPEYAIKAAEQELIDLIDLVDAQSMDKLLEERKISADPNKRMPYFRHYLEHIRAKTEVLQMQITHPEQIKANLEADTSETIDASFEIDPSQLEKLAALKSVIKRFMEMCNHYDIKAKKEYEKNDSRENSKENKEVQVQAKKEIKIVDVNEPPAPWPPDPTRPPIGKPLNTAAETTPTTPATPTFPTSRPPLPFPPIFTRPPAVPPPLPRGLLFEEIITIPDDVPLDVQGDKEFDAWYVAISEKFKAREYLPGSVPDRDLLDLYAQYKEQAPLLKKIQESLKIGDLDKGLGIRTENLDTYRVDQLRHSAFEKLQYSLYEKGEEAEDAINRIFEAIQKTKEYSNEIKGLEARLKAQEKILALNKNRKIDGQDAAAAVEEDQGAFIQENIAGIEAFIEDMKNNFTFYAEAAKSLKADGAQDKIYDRYAAVRGRDSTKHEKIGLLGRLNTRLWGWTSKLFPKKAVQKVWDGISGQGTLKRQEEKDKFWDMIDVMKKHRLVPQQTGSKFQEGAIAQATTNVNLLQQFIGIKFHNQRNEITPVNEELATKMFSELYNAYFNAKTQSTEYQRFARRQVKEAKEFIEEDKAEVVSLNSGISAQEDWISRVFGAEEPELIAETKKELFLLEADALEGKVTSMKVTAKIDELRETRDGLVSLQAKWDGMVSNADLTDPKIVEVIQATEKAFAKKTHELTLMQIRQSAPHPEAVVATVIGKYIIKLQDRDPQIMSRSEKEEACRQLIREIETRLRRNNGFTNATRLTIERAKRQAEVALTTF